MYIPTIYTPLDYIINKYICGNNIEELKFNKKKNSKRREGLFSKSKEY